jgi:hypothetical protein
MYYYKLKNHLPSSPPGMEKSRGSMDHFWMLAARDTAFLLAWSMAAWTAFVMLLSRFWTSSDTVVQLLSKDRHHARVSSASWSRGSPVSGSTSVCLVLHKYFVLNLPQNLI